MKEPQSQNHDSLLNLDTELDRWIHRPPARLLAMVFKKSWVHPNHLTLCALVLACCSAYFFSRANLEASVFGLVFFYAWAVLDHADGELARLKNQMSESGQKLDDVCDFLASNAIMCGIFFGLIASWPYWAQWLGLGLFAGSLWANNCFGGLLLSAKRHARRCAIEQALVNGLFVQEQKQIDRWSGRDPYYALIFFVLLVFYAYEDWISWMAVFLIAGNFGVGIASFWAHRKMRASHFLKS